MAYEELFNHMLEEHDTALLDSEMQEIILICSRFNNGRAVEEINKFNLSDIDAPIFTHSKEFKEHFNYIMNELKTKMDSVL